MRRRRWGVAAVCAGAVLIVGSVVIKTTVAPALIRFPLNTDETAHFSGTATTYVDAKTLLPLKTPLKEPLTLDRHVKVLEGSANRAVIVEDVTIKTPSSTTHESYQYVMDRRSMKFLADAREYAFGDTKSPMHATGAYRVNFAMGTNADGTYRAYIPEVDRIVDLKLVEGKHKHSDANASVLDFSSKLEAPVAPYYLTHLKQIGLPMQVSSAQLQPQLLAAGVDINKVLAEVGPRLSPAESKLVSDTLGKPVPLRYYFIADGLISIEPRTGALIDVHTQREGVAVRPDVSGADVLQPLLAKYSSIPSVAGLAKALNGFKQAAPQPAQMLTYTQTVASSKHMASIANDQAAKMKLIRTTAPLVLAVLGLISLAAGVVLWGRRRRRDVGVLPPRVPEPPKTEAAPTFEEHKTPELV